jgi:hypothetical protein
MAIEAPLSKFKKTNFKIYILVCVVAAVWFGYDGYLSKYEWSRRRSFYEEHFKKLFSIGAELSSDLDNSIISQELRQGFEKNETPLSQHVTVSVRQRDSRWLITDKLKKYYVRKEGGVLIVYEYGAADHTMIFNRFAPVFLVIAAAFLIVRLWAMKDKKLLADENELIITDKEKIPYDSIQKINKTYFDKKGFFIVTYKDKGGNEANRRLSSRKYDNLAAVLDHLVAKIS